MGIDRRRSPVPRPRREPDGVSTTDYLLRSVSTLFLPIMIVLLLIVFGLTTYGIVDRKLKRASHAARVGVAMGLAGAGLVLVGIATITALTRDDGGNNLVTPLLFATGVAMTGGAVVLRSRFGHPITRDDVLHRSARQTFVFLIVAFSLFWEVSIYAQQRGQRDGAQLVAGLACRPDVTLYSDHDLRLDAPGIVQEDLQGGLHRYQGLKLLLHTKNRYFLVAAAWSLADGRTLIVNDDDADILQLQRSC